MEKHISIIGLGWLGMSLAKSLHSDGHLVLGTYSKIQNESNYKTLPFKCQHICFTQNGIEGNWKALIESTRILFINIPPKKNQSGDILFSKYIEFIINNTPASLPTIFISSTSVYGNLNHKITENVQPQPKTLSGQALYESENALKAHFKDQLTILRCSGLIGPNRHPGRFLAGRKDVNNPNGLVNIVHQKDCIEIISKIISKNQFGNTFNLCTNEHPTRSEFYTKAAKLLGLDPPQFATDTNASGKWIDNSKSKELLSHTYLPIEEMLNNC